ncbi:hypothetical protein [Methylophaga sulfidovorans]|uniref:Uncharacterized protein n=1 Tax=Methylophaga sulfidovorans TaxID=45496 RepID=A0A1I3VSK8_9GAMM|nr:hypothetical protein [Methylophaga sulfidovorans]SFJ97267.1 hypothetical protein SAMN04488079_103159 [Methylophaga sulfidovorans]
MLGFAIALPNLRHRSIGTKKPPEGGCFVFGGGGGTVIPEFSFRPGLFLHLIAIYQMESVCEYRFYLQPTLVFHEDKSR